MGTVPYHVDTPQPMGVTNITASMETTNTIRSVKTGLIHTSNFMTVMTCNLTSGQVIKHKYY